MGKQAGRQINTQIPDSSFGSWSELSHGVLSWKACVPHCFALINELLDR